VVKKLVTLFFFIFWGTLVNAQVFTQTFVDRCTGEVKVVTANFTNGPTAVAFYNKVRIFTPQEATNGTLQQWLVETYNWWNTLSPCSQATQQTQQAQQTAQQASQAAQQATTNLPPPPPSNTSTTNSNPPTSNGSSSNSSSSSNSNSSESKTTSESTESGGSSGGGESEGSESSGGESEGGESEGESDSGDGEDESSEGEDSEDSEEDKESEEEDKKKKQQLVNPILVSGDVIGMQSLTGTYNSVLSFGLSQSSIFGDVSYSGNMMVWDNLKQIVLGGSITKMHMNDDYTLDYVDSYALNYSRMYKSNSVTISNSTIKPTQYGTFGFGVNGTVMWSSDMKGVTISYGWNALYTHSIKINERWIYTPAVIMAKNPGSYMSNEKAFYTNKDEIGILSNGFDLQISRRFRINLNYTLIASTNPTFPFMHNFMVGSKLQF
jgi:uncharacterized membrane protein YgcG